MPRRPAELPSLMNAVAVAACLSLAACASTPGASSSLRHGGDLPDHFLVGQAGGGATRAPKAGEGCRNPLIDPRDQSVLILRQSRDGVGDYEVPAGKYGAAVGEWLRIDCASGRALGLVR